MVGIDSAEVSINEKAEIWNNFANHWKLDGIQSISKNVDMHGMMNEINKIFEGRQIGRILLKKKLLTFLFLKISYEK